MARKSGTLRGKLRYSLTFAGLVGFMLLSLYGVRRHRLLNWLKPAVSHPYFDIKESLGRVSLSTTYPEALICYAGTPLFLPVFVQNFSEARISSGLELRDGPGKPVNLGHRFFSTGEKKLLWEGPRYFFRPPVSGAASATRPGHRRVSLAIRCPEAAGRYLLSVELVQEGVAWQADVSPSGHFISMQAIESVSLADLAVETRNFLHFSPNDEISESIRKEAGISYQALTVARRLLDTTSRPVRLADESILVSDAGSNYPMVWVRDMATIHKASGLLKPDARARRHWAEIFFQHQDEGSGQIPDWVALDHPWNNKWSDKNDIQSDQELWLLDSILEDLINEKLDSGWLGESTAGKPHHQRMTLALNWLLNNRFNQEQACIWNGHTADWGDVGLMGHDSETSTRLQYNPGQVCGTFLQTLFLKVADQLLKLSEALPGTFEKEFLTRVSNISQEVLITVRQKLWKADAGHFRMHFHTKDPQKKLAEEDGVFALGSQVIAFEAGLLSGEQISQIHDKILSLKASYNISTAGGVLLPPYPDGTFSNPIMGYFQYQNGGQWDWFGARATLLLEAARSGSGKAALGEISRKVLQNKTFYEWDHPDGKPGAGPHFRAGAAAFVIGFYGLYMKDRSGSLSQVRAETRKQAL